jgi:hypothetical protein
VRRKGGGKDEKELYLILDPQLTIVNSTLYNFPLNLINILEKPIFFNLRLQDFNTKIFILYLE